MQRPQGALDSIYVNSPNTGEAVPLSTFVKWTREPTNFLSIPHQTFCAGRSE
jgi:HAE1 family hydrophobic/amphiphilic exporter-1